MSGICDVWKYWPLKDGWFPCNFAKSGRWTKNFKLLFLLRVAFKILYFRVYCYFCVFAVRRYSMKHKFFVFLKGRYFVMGCPIDMNVCVFWETYVRFLRSVLLQLFPKYSPSNVNLNFKIKSRSKFNCLEKVDELF